MKKIIKKLIQMMGYRVERVERGSAVVDNLKSEWSVDLEVLAQRGESIPGMTSVQSGQYLFALCYFQREEGDVVEIGSWQGRSTSFLAKATKASGNGTLFSVDHFRGNKDKEAQYVFKKNDLSDLKERFCTNMKQCEVDDVIHVLDMPSDDAATHIEDESVRFLFIDGDHSFAGVKRDVELFMPKLCKGAIIAFDDYNAEFPGVVEVVDELKSAINPSRAMTYPNTVVLRT
ncbi:MAG: class I SAM-dependent methyltransferase [Aquisalimonadaceae bacterium]